MITRPVVLVTVAGAALALWWLQSSALAVAVVAALGTAVAAWAFTGAVRAVAAAIASLMWVSSLALAGSPGEVIAILVGCAAAITTAIGGRVWPERPDTYRRDDADVGSPRHMWESLDRGEDPTGHQDLSE